MAELDVATESTTKKRFTLKVLLTVVSFAAAVFVFLNLLAQPVSFNMCSSQSALGGEPPPLSSEAEGRERIEATQDQRCADMDLAIAQVEEEIANLNR